MKDPKLQSFSKEVTNTTSRHPYQTVYVGRTDGQIKIDSKIVAILLIRNVTKNKLLFNFIHNLY